MTPRKFTFLVGHVVGIIGAAWCFYHREWSQGIMLLTGLGLLRFDPPPKEGGQPPRLVSVLPVVCLAALAFGACGPGGAPVDFCAGLHFKSGEPVHEGACVGPLAQGVNADYVRMTAQAALPSQCSGFGCIYTKSSDNLIRFADTSGNERIMGEASRLRPSAGTPADVALTWLWYDSSTDSIMARLSGGSVTLSGPGGAVTVDTTQTITGAKTWSAAAVFNGAVTLGDAIADIIGIKGALRVYNAAGTFYSEITPGATANRAVTLPDAAGAIVLDAAPQTLTNKSIVATQLTGDIAIARMSAALMAPGAIGGSTPAAVTGTTMTATTGFSGPGSSLSSLYAAQWLAHASGALTAGATKYLQTSDSSGEANSQRELYLSLVPTVTTQLLIFGCTLETEPGTGETVTFTVQKSTDRGATYSDTTATCAISGTANECADSTNHPTLNQYDLLAVKLVNTNNGSFAAADAHCSAQVAK